jgi:class 3 adenylate cyclase
MSSGAKIPIHKSISSILLALLTCIGLIVLVGLIILSIRLNGIQRELRELQDTGLPRLVKISQLSQEASASIAVAPALSANPTRFEFETLYSRIEDKEASQKIIIEELSALVRTEDVAQTLGRNGQLLSENLQSLTELVSQQIELRKLIEDQIEYLLRTGRRLEEPKESTADSTSGVENQSFEGSAVRANRSLLTLLLDPNSARFPRNRDNVERETQNFLQALNGNYENDPIQMPQDDYRGLAVFLSGNMENIFEDKQQELSNEFRIKALVKENSRIANRLLSSAANEFWRANSEMQAQVQLVGDTTRITLILIIGIVSAFTIGNIIIWWVLRRRVFHRLNRVRDALISFADQRVRPEADGHADEISSIFDSLTHYMDVIDDREKQLADKTATLEKLSNQLSKYLSPQVYDSIFTGKQQVQVSSTRKKLTVFFSDIADFTETADRLESEELSTLLNNYLTEMSIIALSYGATIDKYIGDAIMVFFGDPESRGVKDDAIACIKMAVAMRTRMKELSGIWHADGIAKPLRVRMGIHTGYCTVGNFGSEDRMDYTIVGGTVNTASRLETLAEPGEIFISYETFALVRDTVHCVEAGEVEVKGIAYPLAVFRVVDNYSNLGERRHIQETQDHFSVEIDLDRMSTEDRESAQEVLKRAMNLLDSGSINQSKHGEP